MVEHKPRIAIVVDDCINKRAIEAAAMMPFPVHGSVIVTHPGVTELVRRNRPYFMQADAGVHINIYEGEFRDNPSGLFGDNGSLHTQLHTVELLRDKSIIAANVLDKLISAMQKKYRIDIKSEMTRQVEIARRLFNWRVPYMTYHFGMHFSSASIAIFEDVAKEQNIRFRRASQYATTPNPGRRHLPFYDQLNIPGIKPHHVLRLLDTIEQSGGDGEICVHFGENERQIAAFLDPKVQRRLRDFSIEMPHEILKRAKFPSMRSTHSIS